MRDREIAELIAKEEERQARVINLIASENYVSDDVRAALCSVFTNKYAEGYPGKRYYGGNEIADQLETLAKTRALKLFGLSPDEWNVNVQPLSGSPANLAVYGALIPTDGKIMGMELSHGGHLTHGHTISFSGKFWTQVPYGVSRETERLDYNVIAALAAKEKPALIVAGFTAYSRVVDWARFRAIADSCGALFMADMSHVAGLVAGGVHPSPFPHADIVTTTTHKTLRGPRSAMIFSHLAHTGKIDRAVFPGLQGGPHVNQIAAVAVALFEASQPGFKTYTANVVANAAALSVELAALGWRIVSGGTDTHLFLVDTFARGVGGNEASERLERAGIIVNKNTIPFDTRKPADPSGMRLGSAAETTRGKTEDDFRAIARKIDAILRA